MEKINATLIYTYYEYIIENISIFHYDRINCFCYNYNM